MKTGFLRFTMGLLALLLAKSTAWGATGFVEITSHDLDQPLCVEANLEVFGEFMLATDDTPRGRADSSTHCHPGHFWAIYSPQCCSDPLNYTNIHARLLYQLNDDSPRRLRDITSYYFGGSGYSQVGELQNFSVNVSRANLPPGEHRLRVYLQDIFGVHCQYWWTSYTYYGQRLGEILDQQTLVFSIPGPDEEGCCDLAIENFTGGGSVNITAGQPAEFTATVGGSPGREIQWELTLLAPDPSLPDPGLIATGANREIAVQWNGRTADGTLVEPGNYTAVLTARLTASPGCASEQSTSLKADWDADCDLNISFGSRANIASGNLARSRPLFALSGNGPTAGLTLHYNSLDPFAGVLGRGWSHSHEQLLREMADGTVLLKKGNGERRLYTPAGDGYQSPPGDYSQLSKNDDHSFTLRSKHGTAYDYSAAGQLTAITDRNDNTLALAYHGNRLATITDPAGRVIEFSYDDQARLATVSDPADRIYAFTVTDNRLQSIILPDGGEWRYTYDPQGFLTAVTDPDGFTSRYQYDQQRRVTTVTDPEGRERSITYPPLAAGNQTAVVTEKDGSEWQYTYDSRHGNLLAKTDPQGGVSQYLYDDHRNLLSRTDRAGNTTTFTYDGYGNLLTLTDPLEQTTHYSYDQSHQVTGITDPAGDFIEYRYDDRGNLAAIIDPTGAKTRYQIDERGNLTAITDPDGRTTTMSYDPAGNLIFVTDPAGTTISLEYDAAGRLVKQRDPLGGITRFEYDSRDNLIRFTDPLGHHTSFTYDARGNRLSQTDANGNTTRFLYNSGGQVVEMIDAEGQVTAFSYGLGEGCFSCADPGAERLTALTDAKGRITSFEHDPLGRLTKERDPLGRATSYLYDMQGNITSRTDPNGQTINYRYDQLGRLVEKNYPDNTSATFTYDPKGQLQTAGNRHISYSFSYDAAGRLTGVADGEGRTIEYAYDHSGRRTRMITPDGRIVDYSYNEAGRLAAITAGDAEFLFTYDELGRRIELGYPNGLTAGYAYDPAGRLTALQHRDATGELLTQSLYTLDQVGNRLSKTTQRQAVAYDYDRIYRLREAVQSTPGFSPDQERGNAGSGRERASQKQKEHYHYDPVGNRLASHLHRDYQHNPANQLQTTPRAEYSYDHNGNLVKKTTSEGITHYRWDYENQLIAVIRPDGVRVEFAYDPFGRRIARKTVGPQGTETVRYVYDHQDIILELDENGESGNRYLHGPGIDEPLALTQGYRTYYYHADGLNSITALTDHRGRIVQEYHYDSFGNLHDQRNRIKQPFTYTGREYDRETGLYYYRARYYDPTIGRFITKDPIGFAGGDVNLYGYVLNNPINWVDPDGLSMIGPVWGGNGHQNTGDKYSRKPSPTYFERYSFSAPGAWDLIAAGAGIASANAPLVAAGVSMGLAGIVPMTVGLTGVGFGTWVVWMGIQQIEIIENSSCE